MRATVGSLAAALIILAAPPAGAQGHGQDTALAARHRGDCRLASQVLTTGSPGPHRDWALEFIGNCESHGPPALAMQWSRAHVEGVDLEQLVRATARLRDARLYRKLRETAQDATRAPAVRVAAMLVLARYSDPQNAIWLTDLRPPNPIRHVPLILSSASHTAQVDGDEPLGAVAAEVLVILDTIAAGRETENTEVWYAAAVLARRLTRDIEDGFAH